MATDQKTLILRGFNKLFTDFIEDIQTIFPDDKNIKFAASSLKMIKQGNPKMLIRVWNKYVLTPYGDKIEEGDIDYFANKDYSQDLSRLSSGQDVMSAIDNIRESIINMSDVNKQHTLEYLQKLCKLCDAHWDGVRIMKDNTEVNTQM